jgi:hypothetical protein
VASTPFLAGLARTLPQLTPGISPDSAAAAFWGAHGSSPSDSPPAAAEFTPQDAVPPAAAAEQDGAVLASPDQAQSPGSPSNVWAELVDLTPGPRDNSDLSMWVSPMGSSPGSCQAAARGSPSFADGCPAVSDTAIELRSTAAAHKKHVSWGSDTEHSVMQQAAAQGGQVGEATEQPDAESVGSASPFEADTVHGASEASAEASNKAALLLVAASAVAPSKVKTDTPARRKQQNQTGCLHRSCNSRK